MRLQVPSRNAERTLEGGVAGGRCPFDWAVRLDKHNLCDWLAQRISHGTCHCPFTSESLASTGRRLGFLLEAAKMWIEQTGHVLLLFVVILLIAES
jgi:hypothetical protein